MPNPFSGSKQDVRRTVAVWSPAARVAGGVPERGFAARVTFFGDDPKKGIKVDGDVVVFAFDEYPGRSAGNNAPDKSYPFLAEDLAKVHSYSKKLGHSYSLWVPWDNAGPDGERKTVSLIVKIVQKNGNTQLSGQAKCLLPGKEPVFVASHSRQEGPISQVNYQFGREDRFDEQLPPGFRDWTKQDTMPEERQIRMTNRPTQMVKTSIPIPGNTYSAMMRNNPSGNPVEFVAAQEVPVQNSIVVPCNAVPNGGQVPVPQYVPLLGPSPTDRVPPPRVEQQGNTTITYFNEPRPVGTNPLAHSM
ncbi:MAG: hypothetical protein FWC43_07720 [Planctomycetaceae bacterium]|nr:hypothetical protein [Planctomycetaceae bacterium]